MSIQNLFELLLKAGKLLPMVSVIHDLILAFSASNQLLAECQFCGCERLVALLQRNHLQIGGRGSWLLALPQSPVVLVIRLRLTVGKIVF